MNAPTIPEVSHLHQAALGAAQGTRESAAVTLACERMDRQREKLQRKLGDVQVAAEVIREVREP